jgi:deoxyribodipyrimidine photo-lyase
MVEGAQIVWFKRDLRVHDHAPLFQAAEHGRPVVPLYIVEPGYWAQPFASTRHWSFIHDCLTDLDRALRALGQPLILRRGEACAVLNALRRETSATTLWAHEETADLWTYERDKRVRRMCRETGLTLRELPSNGVVRRLASRDDWSRIRNQRMSAPLVPKPAILTPVPDCRSEPLPGKQDPMMGAAVAGGTQRGGRRAAVADLQSFLTQRAQGYLRHISSPGASERSCSRLSAHIAWGALSVREVVQALEQRRKELSPLERKSFGRNLSAFGSRLAWRCHFVQKLEDEPRLETRCMHPAFEGMREAEFDPQRFDAWARGRTGYPFVDACMRSLIQQGWITFRMRAMLVSFASYQLWLDWRRTAPYLAQLFTDYEPGIHYSQFQMQSGVTGINTIRVYNPVKQGLDQDPSGTFVRRWVPELRDVPDGKVHEPWSAGGLFDPASGVAASWYPPPIVDHALTSKQAKDRIAAIRKSDGFRCHKLAVVQRHGSRKTRPTTRPKTRRAQGSSPDQLDLFR